MHIGNPLASHTVVVGLPHFLEDESRLGGGQPQIVVGPSPVAQMVVHTGTATAPLLRLIAQARQIAIVVVTPHEHHVVGHA